MAEIMVRYSKVTSRSLKEEKHLTKKCRGLEADKVKLEGEVRKLKSLGDKVQKDNKALGISPMTNPINF